MKASLYCVISFMYCTQWGFFLYYSIRQWWNFVKYSLNSFLLVDLDKLSNSFGFTRSDEHINRRPWRDGDSQTASARRAVLPDGYCNVNVWLDQHSDQLEAERSWESGPWDQFCAAMLRSRMNYRNPFLLELPWKKLSFFLFCKIKSCTLQKVNIIIYIKHMRHTGYQ